MDDKPPSMQQWKALYDAASEFKAIECWDWMWGSDMFGVQDPTSGEIGYCSVTGRLREYFALTVYLGTEGINGYASMRRGKSRSAAESLLHQLKCLVASFEDREFLEGRDMEILRGLGLKFRGRDAWPLFRSYRPGYHPWYLTAAEAECLTLALKQTMDVALRFRDDPDMLTPPAKNRYLVRVYEQAKGGPKWKDEWLVPRPLERQEVVAEPVDRDSLERIKRGIQERRGVWELDFSHSPMAVSEAKGSRPYYPYMLLCVDHDSGFVLISEIAGSGENPSEAVRRIPGLVERTGFLPKEMWVASEDALELVGPFAAGLGIELKRVKRLPALQRARSELFRFLRR